MKNAKIDLKVFLNESSLHPGLTYILRFIPENDDETAERHQLNIYNINNFIRFYFKSLVSNLRLKTVNLRLNHPVKSSITAVFSNKYIVLSFFSENAASTPKPKKVLDTVMSPAYIPAEEKHGSYWRKSAASAIQMKLQEKTNTNKAKNGILFIGKKYM